MNFNADSSIQNTIIPTSNNNYIGLVYSNVLKSSLDTYLPLSGGTLNGNLTTSNQFSQINTSANNFFMGKIGISTTNNAGYDLNVNGSINSTSLLINGINVSNVLIANTSNYASNVSNVIITNSSNFTRGTGTNTSNYASNISNIIINSLNIGNTINSSSNYTSNASNVIIININSNFLKLSGGTLNGNVTINSGNKIIINDSTSLAVPSNVTNIGDRFILRPGNGSTFPYSLGINTNEMWFSVPTSGTFGWYVNGSPTMSLSSGGILTVKDDIVAFGNLSDRRLKTNICNLSINCLDLINTIKSVEFNWKDNYRIPERKRNTCDHGFIAQDIEEILPNLVNNEGEYKSLKYEKFAPYLVKGIQELYKIVQDQQKEINEIKSKLNL